MLLVLANPRRPGRPTPPDVVVPPGGSIWTDDIVVPLAPFKWWRMNDASGSLAANIGSSADAGATIINPAQLERGHPALVLEDDGGGSFGFPGAVTNAPYLSDSDPIVVGASFTLVVVAQLDVFASKYIFMTLGQAASVNGTWSFETRGDGNGTTMRVHIYTGVGGAASVLAGAADSMPLGTPAVVAFVQSSNATTGGRWLYVNGVQVAADTVTKEFAASPAVTGYISAWSDGSGPFNGLMGEGMTFNRALSPAEIATLARAAGRVAYLGDWSASVNESTSGSFDPRPYAHPEFGYTPVVVDEGPIVALTASGSVFNYSAGSVGSNTVEAQTVRLNFGGGVQSNDASLTVTVANVATGTGSFACAGNTNLGTQNNDETTTELNVGGTNASYRGDNIIKRTRWLGTEAAGNNQNTSNQFLFEFGAAHTGGCLRGARIYSNLTRHEDYDPGDIPMKLYPSSDGGQIYYGNNRNVTNFTIEGCRLHGCWDPIRTPGRSSSGTSIAGWKALNCWATCVRDDFAENDGKNEGSIIGCLIGDVINSTSWRVGCWRFYSSTTGSAGINDITIEDNLVWSSLMRATGRANGLSGYVVGAPFKLQNHDSGPVLKLRRNVFMFDHRSFGGGSPTGDPLQGVKGNEGAQAGFESEDNIVVWRDLGGIGSYPWSLPPGFTLLTGSEGETEWNNRVNAWKAANSHVPRFNIGTVNRANAYHNQPAGTGTSFNLVDVG